MSTPSDAVAIVRRIPHRPSERIATGDEFDALVDKV
jgi:hypothetical protein